MVERDSAFHVAWRSGAGLELGQPWSVRVRAAGTAELLGEAVATPADWGRDPDSVGYAAQVPSPGGITAVDLVLRVERPDGPVFEFQDVAVRTPAAPPRTGASEAAPPFVAAGAPTAGERIRLTVAETGLYVVSVAELAGALADVGENDVRQWIASTNLVVSSMGQPVPWHPVGDSDGIAFVGEGYRDVFTDQNAYWIEAGPGLRMEEQAVVAPGEPWSVGSFQETLRFEEDVHVWEDRPAEREMDVWYWDWTFESSASSRRAELPFRTPAAVPEGETTLRLWVRPHSTTAGLLQLELDPDTRVEFALEGVGPHVIEWSVPGERLAELNTLSLQARRTGFFQVAYFLDSLTVGYQRTMLADNDQLLVTPGADATQVVADGFSDQAVAVYGLGSDGLPVRLLGAGTALEDGAWRCAFEIPAGRDRFLIAGTPSAPATLEGVAANPWAGDAHEVDYLVVAPAAFLPALEPLLTVRGSQFSIGVLTTEVLYTHYNDGRFSPYALRKFLQSAQAWAGPPRFVLLVGHGTYDYRALMGDAPWQPNHVPPGIVAIPYQWSLTGVLVCASDNDLADLDGDGLPAVALGRLPARTVAEVERMVAKTLAHESRRPARTNAFAVADDGGLFDWNSESWRSRLPAAIQVSSVTTWITSDMTTAQQQAERTRVRDAWWDQMRDGVWLHAYFGHASQWSVGRDTPWYIDHREVDDIGNVGRDGILLGTTCRINNWAPPRREALWSGCVGADLLRATDGGMVAVLAPSSPSFEKPGGVVAEGFVDAWALRQRRTIGEAVRDGLIALHDHPDADLEDYRWLTRTMVLFGDPALDVRPAAGVLTSRATLIRVH